MCKENFNNMTWEEQLDKIIQDPDGYSYRKLRKVVTGIYNDEKVSEESMIILDEKIKKIERLFGYKTIGPYLSIISILAGLMTGSALSCGDDKLFYFSLILIATVAIIIYKKF